MTCWGVQLECMGDHRHKLRKSVNCNMIKALWPWWYHYEYIISLATGSTSTPSKNPSPSAPRRPLLPAPGARPPGASAAPQVALSGRMPTPGCMCPYSSPRQASSTRMPPWPGNKPPPPHGGGSAPGKRWQPRPPSPSPPSWMPSTLAQLLARFPRTSAFPDRRPRSRQVPKRIWAGQFATSATPTRTSPPLAKKCFSNSMVAFTLLPTSTGTRTPSERARTLRRPSSSLPIPAPCIPRSRLRRPESRPLSGLWPNRWPVPTGPRRAAAVAAAGVDDTQPRRILLPQSLPRSQTLRLPLLRPLQTPQLCSNKRSAALTTSTSPTPCGCGSRRSKVRPGACRGSLPLRSAWASPKSATTPPTRTLPKHVAGSSSSWPRGCFATGPVPGSAPNPATSTAEPLCSGTASGTSCSAKLPAASTPQRRPRASPLLTRVPPVQPAWHIKGNFPRLPGR